MLPQDAASNHFLCSKMRFKKNDFEADLPFQISHYSPPPHLKLEDVTWMKSELAGYKQGVGADLDSLCFSEGSDGKSFKPVIWGCSTFGSKFVAIKSCSLEKAFTGGMIRVAAAELCMGFVQSLLADKYVWRNSGFSLQHHQCLEPSPASLGTPVLGFVVALTHQLHPMAGTSLAAGLKVLGQNVGFFSEFT